MSWDLVVKFNNQNWKPLSNESGYQITEKDKKRTFGFVDEEEGVGFDMGKRAASKSVFCWFLEEIIDVFCANVRSPCFLSFSWGFCFLPHLSLVPNTLCVAVLVFVLWLPPVFARADEREADLRNMDRAIYIHNLLDTTSFLSGQNDDVLCVLLVPGRMLIQPLSFS